MSRLSRWFLVVWAMGATLAAIAFYICAANPTKAPPVFERGHRGFEAHNEVEREAYIEVLALGGLKPVMRFKVGPTDQTLMSDGMTVVNLMNHAHADPSARFSGNFISLVTSDPKAASLKAKEILARLGGEVVGAEIPIPEKKL